MGKRALKLVPVSGGLVGHTPTSNELYLAHEEGEAFKRFKDVLNTSMGAHAAGAATRAAKDARIKGMVRACAETLVHRTISGKNKDAGLDAIARIQTDFDDEVTKQYDAYVSIHGGV